MRATRCRPAAARAQQAPQRPPCAGVHTGALPVASPARATLTRPRAAFAVRARPASRGLARVSAGDAAAEEAPPALSGDMTWPQRDCECGTLRDADVGRRVTLCGWVDKQRNMGAVVFADVRDHTGIVQVRASLASGSGTAHASG
jgi:aspartyl-tRNA synthetase